MFRLMYSAGLQRTELINLKLNDIETQDSKMRLRVNMTLPKYDIYASTFHYWKVQRIVEIKLDPDHANHYRLIGFGLCLLGYFLNHKKVYRLMFEYLLLEEPRRRSGRGFVKYRRIASTKALEVLEMDIKYVWVYEKTLGCWIYDEKHTSETSMGIHYHPLSTGEKIRRRTNRN